MQRKARSSSRRSITGDIPRRTLPLVYCLNSGRLSACLGLVQGSTAPSSTDLERSGMARSMSKSMVLPKPWQRLHAPKGVLKLNKVGSGSTNCLPHCLQLNFWSNRMVSPPAAGSNRQSPGLAIANLYGVHQALASSGGNRDRSTSTDSGFVKSMSSSDSGVENSNTRSALIEAIEALAAEVKELIPQCVRGLFRSNGKQRIPARAIRQGE